MAKENNAAKETGLIVSLTSKKLSAELTKAETAIRQANLSFTVIGENLTVINTKELYKQRGFGTFELYVTTIFDFTRDYAYKIMAATRVFKLLQGSFKPSELPKAETHCRPLTKIEHDDDVIAIWSDVVATGKIIAKTVIELVNVKLGKAALNTTTTTGDAVNTAETVDTVTETVEGETGKDDISAVEKVRILEARIVQLENDLEKARSAGKGIAKTKMAREMIQKGFAAMAKTVTDDQKAELIATKQALLG